LSKLTSQFSLQTLLALNPCTIIDQSKTSELVDSKPQLWKTYQYFVATKHVVLGKVSIGLDIERFFYFTYFDLMIKQHLFPSLSLKNNKLDFYL
jgi:hypothetical protein